MKKIGVILIIGMMLPLSALATQNILIDESDAVEFSESGQNLIQEKSVAAVSSANPQIIINQKQETTSTTQQPQVSHQPVLHVTGSVIEDTYDVELKKSRIEAEKTTEQTIREHLESARLKDEQKRLQAIVAKNNTPQQSVIYPNPVSQNSVVQPSIVSSVNIQEEDVNSERVYIGIAGGQPANLTPLNRENIKYYGSVGVAFGATNDNGISLESSLFYTEHAINSNNFGYNIGNFRNNVGYNALNNFNDTNVEQVTGTLSLKFTPFQGRFQPYAGIAISYNRWLESNNNIQGAYYNTPIGQDYNSFAFDSIDLGSNVGVDFLLNKKVSVGFNMLINILNLHNNRLTDTHNLAYNYNGYNPLNRTAALVTFEETNWLIASVNVKLYF